MSSRCMAAVFERYPSGGGEFTLALALADNAHDDGSHIFPSVDTMAHKSRQTARNVQNHLRAMLESGWLLLVKRSGGRGRPTEYRISPSWLKGEEIAPIPRPVDKSEKGEKRSTKRVKTATQKGENGDTPYITRRTSIEPIPPDPPRGDAPGFDAIASEYPRKSHLTKAAQEWRELAPDEQLARTILASIRAWTRSPEWQREDGRFVPKLSNWLRDKRWQDVPGYSAPPPTPAPTPAPAPPLNPEQLRINGQRAAQAVRLARQLLVRQPSAVAA